MKFRYKVFLVNIIVLSIGLGMVGYWMIQKNFTLALEHEQQLCVEENNLLQATVEYRLLRLLNENARLEKNELSGLGDEVADSLQIGDSQVYLYYGGQMLIHTDEEHVPCPQELLDNCGVRQKQQIIEKVEDRYYLFTCTANLIDGQSMQIVNRRDVTSVYDMMKKQHRFFAYLMVLVGGLCGFAMLIFGYILTKPLEQLNKVSTRFGEGDYEARTTVHSADEVGELAQSYNQMADSVCDHMEELQNMVRRQEQFVADFTHEIKTPMTTIIGYADTLRSKEMSRENQILAASYIFQEGKRLEDMSMKLFDFIYTKEHGIVKKPVYLPGIMKRVCDSVNPAFEQKNIPFIIHSVPVTILGDDALLKTAWINILDNARKASESGSRVLFEAQLMEEAGRKQVCVRVQDFGIGIEKEHLQRICDEFYMVDKSRSRKEGGAGLGLSLAALIFESHDCHLEIESSVGVGTTMSVIFDVYEEKEYIHEEEA